MYRSDPIRLDDAMGRTVDDQDPLSRMLSSDNHVPTCHPTLKTLLASRGAPSSQPSVPSPSDGFPPLLGASALTLEPTTVSMQQIGVKSPWPKEKSDLPRGGNSDTEG